MHRRAILFIIIFLSFTASYLGKKVVHEFKIDSPKGFAADKSIENNQNADFRIVSMAPSITETLFTLGLGAQVVGVTRHCDYPPEARRKAIIGGYHEPYYEAVAEADPDLCILFYDQAAARKHLARLGYNLLLVSHKSISGILSSITNIGRASGAEKEATALVDDLKGRMVRIQQETEGLRRPRVMISVGRNMGSRSIKDATITGKGVFHNEMIVIAGGKNAYSGRVGFPAVSKEGIIQMNPEVIIEMIPDLDKKGLAVTAILKEWEGMITIDAVKDGRVHVIGADYAVRPGPRFILVLEEMARIIHPEVSWP